MVIIEGLHYKNNTGIRIEIRDGIIESIEPTDVKSETYIAPGFVDLQVNGYMGVDFNSLDLTESDIEKVCLSLLEQGVTSFYPTVITNSSENMVKLVGEISNAVSKNELARQMIAGIHLEGPFLSVEDGPRGAHNREYIQAPDWEFFKKLNESGFIKIVTLSPDWEHAEEFIKLASESGILVSIGHTNANSVQIQKAVKAGAKMSTHLGNGAHVMLPRHPNYLWDQLAENELAATVIADGFHLPTSVLKVIEKVKKEKMVIISDSVALAGLPAGEYTAAVGGEVTLTEEGRLHLRGEPRLLAGSAQSILWGVNRIVEMGVTDLPTAIEKASVLPAKIMGLEHGLQVGAPADLILYKKGMEVTETIKAGNVLYRGEKE
ncbi:N-acetylglucosamine-6-phosphate deacetylase [Bacillus sp. HNG]|uniref:N-acetylglucosamine-6-phosphate deacetylase n=1 Tax=Bacillus sp. HNG TaxID=2293325 RepID=UPI001CB90AD1|nr:N-acetylglucosamine-6-phosphate deacetylase [Bacillus sp. HNG]